MEDRDLEARISEKIQDNMNQTLIRFFQTINDDLKSYFIKNNAIQSKLSEALVQ